MSDIIAPPAPAAEPAHSSAANGLLDAFASMSDSPEASLSPNNDFLSRFNADVADPEPPKVEDDSPAPKEEPKDEKPEGTVEGEEDDPHGEVPDPKDDKANEKWVGLKGDLKKTRAELREERNRVAAELGTRDAEITSLKEAKITLEREIAELAESKAKAARVEEVEKELSIHRVESSDLYKRSVTEPLNAISDRLEAIAKDNSIDVNDLYDAISETDPAKQRAALKELMASLDPLDQPFVAQAVGDVRSIFAKRDQIRADASNARKEMEEKQAAELARAREASSKELLAEFDKVGENIKKRMPFVELVKGETADGVFAAALEQAKATDFDALTPSTKAFMATSGILLARLIKQSQARETYIKTLEGRVTEDGRLSPKVDGKETAAPAGQSKKGESFTANVAGFLGQSQSRSSFVPGG